MSCNAFCTPLAYPQLGPCVASERYRSHTFSKAEVFHRMSGMNSPYHSLSRPTHIFYARRCSAIRMDATTSSSRRKTIHSALFLVFGAMSATMAGPAVSVAAGSEAAAEAKSGLISGVAVSTVKQVLLYPVDTVKVRLQDWKSEDKRPLWKRSELFKDLYKGFLVPFVFNAPSGGVFFAAKDSIKASLSSLGNIPSTLVAIFFAQIPYWIVRQPSEIFKVQRQIASAGDSDSSDTSSIRDRAGIILGVLKQLDPRNPEALRKLFTGYGSNIVYTFPADAIKFVAYDALKARAGKKNPLKTAVLGALSTILAQSTTTPLDVARNRIMGSQKLRGATLNGEEENDGVVGYESDNVLQAIQRIVKEDGAGALMLGLAPRVLRAVLSGAIQFTTYEITKGAVK